MTSTDLQRAALLGDPTRKRVFDAVRRKRGPVTREQIATTVRISTALAAFHLDKLLDGGLLVADYARPPGRTGPGAGRPAKRYSLSEAEIDVSIPARRYDLAGSVLGEAIRSERPGEGARAATLRVARARGTALASRDRRPRAQSRRSPLEDAAATLTRLGFEPVRERGGEITLRNCPFRALALEDPDLVCDMNRAFVAGVVAGAKATGDARIEPTRAAGRCCVKLCAIETERS